MSFFTRLFSRQQKMTPAEAIESLFRDHYIKGPIRIYNLGGYKVKVVVSPGVREPLLLIPPDGEQLFGTHVRNRFGVAGWEALPEASEIKLGSSDNGDQY